jgi:2-dehydro-3-deoxyphosphogluconate aldolase / (4S)-4-hydroxy-2-oxoglutarate aldolase
MISTIPAGRAAAVAAIREARLIAIVRAPDAESALRTSRDLITAGVRVLEVSLTTPGAVGVIDVLVRDALPGVLVGAGTVLTPADASAALDAGARFLISPAFAHDVVRAAHERDAAAIPGIMTPTEAVAATQAGADLVKLFPASSASPGVLRDLLQALPKLSVVPTGGVHIQDAADWIRAGAVAVGMGSALTSGSSADQAARFAALSRELTDAAAGRLTA